MLMMKIEMNADKIQTEQRYTVSAINRTIESAFAQMQLHKIEDASGALLYRDSDNARDYGRFGRVVNTLKNSVLWITFLSGVCMTVRTPIRLPIAVKKICYCTIATNSR